MGNRLLGPVAPYIERVRGQYQRSILLKVERNNSFVKEVKLLLMETKATVKGTQGMSSVRINIDVDPY